MLPTLGRRITRGYNNYGDEDYDDESRFRQDKDVKMKDLSQQKKKAEVKPISD